MASPEREQLDAIAGAIARLARRFDQLEARVARLEAERAPAQEAPAPADRIEPPLPLPALEPPPPAPPAPSLPEPERLETRFGLTWVNRIGVVTLIIGIAFFFKYAVDSHWIGESGRVMLGILAGLVTLIAGDRLWRRHQATFSQGLFGLGIALLYLSFFASFGFYHIVPQGLAFILMALTTSTAGAIAVRYNALSIAWLGLLGGYATPLLLSTGVDAPWTFFGYLLVLNFGALAVARTRSWRSLEVLALSATIVLYFSWYEKWFTPEKRLVATVFPLAFYGLFSTIGLAPLFFAGHVAVALCLGAIWHLRPGPFLLFALLVAVAGLAVAGVRRWGPLALAALLSFWLVCALWWHVLKPENLAMAGLTAGFLMFYGWTVWSLAVKLDPPRRQDLVALASNGPAYFGLAYAMLHGHYADWMGLFAVALAALHLAAGAAIWRSRPEQARDPVPALLAGGVAVAFLTLAAPIQFSGYRITLGWALEATALTWIGWRLDRMLVATSGAVLFVLTLSRLHGIDAWMYPDPKTYAALLNARFFTFLVAALAFWLGALWTRARILALLYYVVGHWVLLWAFSLEILGWAARHAAPEDVINVESMTFSILVALYALVLVALGFVQHSTANRLFALVLIALVVAKLYLYDVWQLQRLYRMGAFVGLGVLLLGTSYLYSRHRQTIESWWKRGAPRN